MPIVQKRIKIDNHSILYDLKVAKNVKAHIYASFLLSQISAYIAILCMLYKHETRRSLMVFKADLSCFFSMLRYRISTLATGLLAEF
jgi:hypothetical protein